MLLTEKRPLKTPYVFGGRSFLIDMAFNNILSMFEIMEDNELMTHEKGQLAAYFLTSEEEFLEDDFLAFKENKEFLENFLDAVFEDLIIDKNTKEAAPTDLLGNPLPQEEGKQKSFDFVHDASFIYASFFHAYHMDLHRQHNKMHYEVFIALFNGLPAETIMMKVIDIREREMPSGKGTEKDRKQLKEAKERFALPGTDIFEEDEE